MSRFGFSLRIPTSEYVHVEGGNVLTLPYLKPTDLLSSLLNTYPWLFLGRSCDGPDTNRLLLAFWDCYKADHPTHEVFQYSRERLSKTFPVTSHGDGGRTAKKLPLEVVSIQAVLGLDSISSTKPITCRCCTSVKCGVGSASSPNVQRLNSKHSTYLTHFLLFAYPSKAYSKEFPKLLTAFVEHVLTDLGAACRDGIAIDNDRMYPCCIGFKHDMEWAVKVASLMRSYQNVGHIREIPCCHECLAGSPNIPFEDVNITARWIGTRWRSIPWSCDPPWKDIPFDNTKASMFLRRDAFHIFRLGIGRNFIASCVYLLIFMGCTFASFSPLIVLAFYLVRLG